MFYAIITVIAGIVLGGFLGVITCTKEAHDSELVCWEKQDW